MELLGLLLPLVIDLVNRHILESDKRYWVSILICFSVGVFINFLEHNGFIGYSGMTYMQIADSLSLSALSVFALAKIVYDKVWEKSDLREDLGLNAKSNLQLDA